MDSFFENVSSSLLLATVTAMLLIRALLSNSFRCLLRGSPGPWGVPFLGFYPFLRKDDYFVHLAEMAKTYGDAYLLSLGNTRYVHLSSYKAIQEAFVTKSNCFEGRSHEFSALQHLLDRGVTFVDNEPWRVWRKFVVQKMKELGLSGKDLMSDSIAEALQSTLNTLKKNANQPVDFRALLTLQCTECVRQPLLGGNIPLDMALKLNQSYLEGNFMLNKVDILFHGRIARYLILPWSKDFKRLLASRKQTDLMLYAILEEHKRHFDPNHPKDFVDMYLLEKKVRKEKGDHQAKYFNDSMFVGSMTQTYGDSAFSIGEFVAGYLKFLAEKTELQNAIYEEIVREIGTERVPTYEDRNRLPFTQSVLREIERTKPPATIIPSLETSCDMTISGVFVPKGTVTLINFYAIQNDPLVYKDPERFDPERFMPDEKTKCLRVPLPLTFGIGKRACLGETLVRSQLFIFITTILQNFALEVENTKLSRNPDEKHFIFDVTENKRVIPICRSTSISNEL